MKKEKSYKTSIIGYTNSPIETREDIFANAVIVKGNKNLQPLNDVKVHVCTILRKEECDKKQECERCTPTCCWDERKFLGVSGDEYDNLGSKRRSRIHAKLKRLWLKCRKIQLSVEAIEEKK